MENAQLDKIEKMLQVALEAICSLAKEVTGRSMVIGHSDGVYLDFGATPLSEDIKWVASDLPADPSASDPTPLVPPV